MEVFEIGDAPAATCPCAQAFGDQGCNGRVFSIEIALDFAKRHAEAEADMVIGFHGSAFDEWGALGCLSL